MSTPSAPLQQPHCTCASRSSRQAPGASAAVRTRRCGEPGRRTADCCAVVLVAPCRCCWGQPAAAAVQPLQLRACLRTANDCTQRCVCVSTADKARKCCWLSARGSLCDYAARSAWLPPVPHQCCQRNSVHSTAGCTAWQKRHRIVRISSQDAPARAKWRCGSMLPVSSRKCVHSLRWPRTGLSCLRCTEVATAAYARSQEPAMRPTL